MKANQINYFTSDKLDTNKWDSCIANAPNSLVYAQSWYLDKTCERWNALIFGDYQYVMPLTYKKKYGISYLYQPFFSQQLGVFPTPTKDILLQFLTKAQKHFKYADINLNSMNLPVETKGTFEARKNYLLSLSKPYSLIQEGYNKHTKRNLKKAQANKLNLIRGISAEEFLQFKKDHYKLELSTENFSQIKNILLYSQYKSMGQIYGVYSNQNMLCASVFFIRYKRRVTYLSAISSDEGRDLNAMHYLIDKFISDHANSEFIIDFEGSSVAGIARFYEGFGATPETFYQLHWNSLPALIKWIKK